MQCRSPFGASAVLQVRILPQPLTRNRENAMMTTLEITGTGHSVLYEAYSEAFPRKAPGGVMDIQHPFLGRGVQEVDEPGLWEELVCAETLAGCASDVQLRSDAADFLYRVLRLLELIPTPVVHLAPVEHEEDVPF